MKIKINVLLYLMKEIH